MNTLQVKGKKIVDSKGNPIRLRGTCIGGWMNMENFIDGYPGTESGIRRAISDVLGEEKAEYFFDRFLNYFFNEEDIKFIKECGATVVRIPLNYRHFEDDEAPFVYKEQGFKRLNKVIDWCEKYGLYVILDMHAVQGWQNSHWHSDNNTGISLFWRNAQYQDRYIALWQEFARRYNKREVIAGYNIMNEPCTNTPDGDYPYYVHTNYKPDWDRMNRVYRKVVEAIRAVDPEHIIFIEGDCYSHMFSGLEAPFAENLIYSSHNYTSAGFGPGIYPGEFRNSRSDRKEENGYWDRNKQAELFKGHEGTVYTDKYNVPLWVGEFGSQYNGPKDDVTYRLRAIDDQIDVFEEFDAHWTTWTYKDVGIMGWVMLDPESEYMKLIKPVQEKKNLLGAENFTGRFTASPAKNMVKELAGLMEQVIGESYIDPAANIACLGLKTLAGYAASLLEPIYANLFKGMSWEDIDRILQSFDIKNCKINEGLIEILKKHMSR